MKPADEAAAAPAHALVLLAACSGAPKPGPPPPRRRRPRPSRARRRRRHRRRPALAVAPAQEDPSKRGDYTAGGLYAPRRRRQRARPSCPMSTRSPSRCHAPSRAPLRQPLAVHACSASATACCDRAEGYVERGIASWYGKKFHGRRTSSRELYDMCTLQRRAQDPAAAELRARHQPRQRPQSWSCASTTAARSMPAASST